MTYQVTFIKQSCLLYQNLLKIILASFYRFDIISLLDGLKSFVCLAFIKMKALNTWIYYLYSYENLFIDIQTIY